jgi:predicted Zn-dependent protease
MARGRPADAVPDLRAAVAALGRIGAGADLDRLEGMLGEALLRSGSPAEAERLLGALLGRLPDDAPGRQVVTELHAEAGRATS